MTESFQREDFNNQKQKWIINHSWALRIFFFLYYPPPPNYSLPMDPASDHASWLQGGQEKRERRDEGMDGDWR